MVYILTEPAEDSGTIVLSYGTLRTFRHGYELLTEAIGVSGTGNAYTRINSLGLFLVHKLTCGKRESVS